MGEPERDFRIRFAVFELDTRSGELRNAGSRVKLQDQPLKVLTALLEQPGAVVTREELKRRIWPEDSFGDFDHAVNVAVAKLRTALGDSADVPRFVETLPRRGYRFIFPVTPPREAESGGASVAAETKLEPVKKSSRLRWAATASIVVFGLGVGAWWVLSRKPHALTDKDTIVVADFTNTTGDTVFDGTLRQGLSVQLEQSPFLSLVSEQQIQQTLQMMGQKPDAKLTPEISRDVCQRTGSAAVIEGSIAQIGTPYLLTVKAVKCASGESLASTEAQAKDKNNVLDALGKTASEIRNKLGESLRAVQKFDTPLQQATTPSLEALQAFTLGAKILGDGDSAAAVPFLQRANFYSPAKNTSEMVKLLHRLVDVYADQECIYFSWDVASWHASKGIVCESSGDQ
jgi:DNA-binding winged helix-turn-helix (wHTH) protein